MRGNRESNVSTQPTLLLVEDEPRVARFIKQGLEEKGYVFFWAGDGKSALELFTQQQFDVVVVDVGLPAGMDGFEVTRLLREARPDVPILMLTARDDPEDIVRGLDCGADDYVTKPFDFLEFEARLRALARRSAPASSVIQAGPFEIDCLRQSVLRGTEPVALTRTEFKILEVIASAKGQVVRRADLHDEVWGLGFDPGTRVIDVHLAHLRQKLASAGGGIRIVTERGVGLRVVEGD